MNKEIKNYINLPCEYYIYKDSDKYVGTIRKLSIKVEGPTIEDVNNKLNEAKINRLKEMILKNLQIPKELF